MGLSTGCQDQDQVNPYQGVIELLSPLLHRRFDVPRGMTKSPRIFPQVAIRIGQSHGLFLKLDLEVLSVTATMSVTSRG